MRQRLTTMVLVLGAATADAKMSAGLQSLVDAERAFANASVTSSMRAAFLAFLADDAIVFRPLPTNGKAFYSGRPESKVVLSWEPVLAEISRAGDLGYTAGPWEYRPEASAPPAAYGHYVSVWKKQPDGSWKVAVDAGVSHDKLSAHPSTHFREAGVPRRAVTATDASRDRAALLAIEGEIAAEARTAGANAVRARSAADAWVFREGAIPAAGSKDGISARGVVPIALGGEVSASGDLGYTYGTVAPVSETATPAPTSCFFRIWRKDASGTWKVIVDVDSPVTAE